MTSCGKTCICLPWFSRPCLGTCCSSNSRATSPDIWISNFSSYTWSSGFHSKEWRWYRSKKKIVSVSYSHRYKLIEKERNPLFWCNMQGTESLKNICIFPQDMFWHSSFPDLSVWYMNSDWENAVNSLASEESTDTSEAWGNLKHLFKDGEKKIKRKSMQQFVLYFQLLRKYMLRRKKKKKKEKLFPWPTKQMRASWAK